jgi:hypothetical protein
MHLAFALDTCSLPLSAGDPVYWSVLPGVQARLRLL